MSEPYRKDFPNNQYRVDPIYARMTLPRNTNDGRASFPGVRDLFGELSVVSQFKVTLFLGDTVPTDASDSDINAWLVSCGVLGSNIFNGGQKSLNSLRYEFMCNKTDLPGVSLAVSEETGSRQGVVETFPVRRNYEDISMTFYVDAEYGIIRLFEEWINFINPLYNTEGRKVTGNPRGEVGEFDSDQFFRFRYPDTYKRDIAITKFERDLVVDPSTKDVVRTPTMMTYKFINAYPVNLAALPLTYEGSTITKTTVTFKYDRYVILNHAGTGQDVRQDSQINNNGQNSLLANPTVSWANQGNTFVNNPSFDYSADIPSEYLNTNFFAQ